MNRVSSFRRVAPWLAVSLLSTPLYALAGDGLQSLDEVRAAAQSYVQNKMPRQAPGTIDVSVGSLDSRLRLASCAGPLKASLAPGAAFSARMIVAVSCPNGAAWTVYVPVNVESHTSVLVLRHSAARGDKLSAADVENQMRVVSGPGDAYVTNVTQLERRTLKRPLGAGSALTVDSLVDDALVKRGQQVTLLASVGGLEVRAAGLAMSDAPAEGRVKVQNLSSRRIVEGVVETADVIRITP